MVRPVYRINKTLQPPDILVFKQDFRQRAEALIARSSVVEEQMSFLTPSTFEEEQEMVLFRSSELFLVFHLLASRLRKWPQSCVRFGRT